MKTMKRLMSLVLCLMLGVAPFFTACGENGEPTQYTISFYQDSAAETAFDTMKVEKGKVPDLSGVTPPEKSGEEFVGWTDARNSSTPYDTTKAVEADLDLYGMWQPAVGKKVKVTFDFNYEGSKSVVKEGGVGGPLEFPVAEREYYVFKGWCRDKNGETPYESLNYPDSALTLYAKWELAQGAVLVTFMLGDEKFTDIATANGGKVTAPACDPAEYVFLKWVDGDGEPVNFQTTVFNQSTTIYADYYSRGLEVDGNEVIGYDEDYGKNVVVPATWYGDDGTDEGQPITTIADLGGINCETIVLAEGITTIGNSAFANDSSLKKIVIPTTVTSIGTGIFQGCDSLVEKHFEGNNTLEVVDGIVLSADKTTALLYVGDAPNATVNVPATVTRIEKFAFSYANIQKLVVPDTVEAIVENAFANSLIREAEVSIKAGKQAYLPQNAFNGSSLLTKVTLSASITTIQVSAFENCLSLSDITINAETINLRNRAFYYCSALESFPFDKVNELGDNVFAFAGIKEFSFNGTVTEVKANYFANWDNLETVTLPKSITTIGESAFDGCAALTTLNIAADSELKEIGARAFAGTKLAELDLTACTKLETIGEYAFSGCASITSVKLPDSLHTIGARVFSGCSAIEEMTLPFVGSHDYEGFKSFFKDSFIPTYCAQLAYQYLTSTQHYLDLYEQDPEGFANQYMSPDLRVWYELHKDGKEADYYQKSLTEVFSTAQLFGYIFDGNSYAGSTLIQQYMSVGDSGTPTTYNFYIPTSLKKITVTGKAVTAYAFNSMVSYTGTFAFTNKLEDIGESAFRTDTAIPAFDFSTATNLKTIGANAFSSDRGLTQVVFPDSLEVVGASAFRFCSNLASVQVPTASTAKPLVLGAYAFGDCTSLSSFYGKGDTPVEGTFKFKNVNLSNYTFLNCSKLQVVESPESVGFILGYYGSEGTQLMCNPFYTDSLIEVKFPTDVENYRYTLPKLSATGLVPTPEEAERQGFVEGCIPGRLFYGCGGLTKFNADAEHDVVIPAGATAIGPYAFQAYTGPSVPNMPIETISFPDSLKKIYEGAFGHTDLKDVDASMVEDLSSGFDFANKLERIIISKTLELTPQVLRSCASLKTVALKDAAGTVTEEKGVVLLPDGTTKIPNYAFQNSGIEVVRLSSAIETIGTYSFYGAECLETVELPAELKTVGNGAFERCFGLTNVKFAESGKLNYIGNAAFEYCTSLQKITIPEGVVYLGADAFMGSIKLETVILPSTLFYAGGSSLFCNCLSLKEVVLLGSVPPQVDFDIADTSYAYSAFNIADQNYIASIPAAVAAELAKLPQTVTQNDRTMVENLKDFENYFVKENGLKIYIPEDAKSLYDENIANGLRVVGGTQNGKGQRKDFGWHNYKSAFTTFESGVFAEQGSTSPIAVYAAADGKIWLKNGSAAMVEGTNYTAGDYTYNAETNALTKGSTLIKSIGGVYMDVTDTFATGSAAAADRDTRLAQFRPQLVLGANGAAAMYVYDAGGKQPDEASNTLYVPNLYYGTYTLAWSGDTLTVSLNFSKLTFVGFASNYANIQVSDIKDSEEAAARTITFTLTEQSGVFTSSAVTGTKLGDVSIVFTRGCTVTDTVTD